MLVKLHENLEELLHVQIEVILYFVEANELILIFLYSFFKQFSHCFILFSDEFQSMSALH